MRFRAVPAPRRVNVAARGCGVALRALELAVGYARQRHAFGKPIAEHEAVLFRLAEMATKVEAAHQMMVMAARRKDGGGRGDLEAGMAKYLASEHRGPAALPSLTALPGGGALLAWEENNGISLKRLP